MIQSTLSAIAKQLEISDLAEDADFSGISTDTRTLTPGNLYIAIQGESLDGHDFVEKAAKQGANAALVSKQVNCPLPQLVVSDTILALGKIAKHWRDLFSLPLIGVTGSNGKTTLKNMIAAILRAACHNQSEQVLATDGNLNNHIGLPLNLVRLNEQHRYAVLEMGMNHFGEIAYLTQLARPTVAVINNAGEAHLAGVKDLAGVAKAKGEIFLGLNEEGIAVLNRDDAFFDYWRTLIGKRQFISFGLDHPADVSATYTVGHPLLIKSPLGVISVNLTLLGKHNVMNALAATAAALSANIDLNAIKTGLENVKAAPGRMRQYELPNHALVIDDTYNANPFSLRAAVNTLSTYPGKKIVVLGDMKELGPDEKQLHFQAGQHIKTSGIDYLFTLGNLSEETTKAFGNNANAKHFTDYSQLIDALKPHLTKEVTVLVKGSRSMHMEKIIAGIIPETQLEHTH